jgi:hypothetical protein
LLSPPPRKKKEQQQEQEDPPPPRPTLRPVPCQLPAPVPVGTSAAAGPAASSTRAVRSSGGVDYDSLILAAKSDAQRATYTKMKAKAEARAMREQIEALYLEHNPAKLPEIPGLIEKYGAESLLGMAQRKYRGPLASIAAAGVAVANASDGGAGALAGLAGLAAAAAGAVASATSDGASAGHGQGASSGSGSGSGGKSNKRISLVFFTRPCAGAKNAFFCAIYI